MYIYTCIYIHTCILYSYNTFTRELCVYFSHIPSKRVITVMLHTLEVESIVSIIVKL